MILLIGFRDEKLPLLCASYITKLHREPFVCSESRQTIKQRHLS